MTYVINHVNEYVPNLEWQNDSLVKMWRGDKGWSLHVLYEKVLRMTLHREVDWCFMLYLNLGSLKDYLGNLEESVWAFSSRFI